MPGLDRDRQIDLVGTAEVLHKHLTGPLVSAAFEDLRGGERERVWTLQQMMAFWTAVILRAPKSLSEALREAAGSRASGYPPVETSNQAFFQRCSNLRWDFFAHVFRAFVQSVSAEEPARFARHHQEVAARFGNVLIFDGSNLEPVARRLKITWGHSAAPVPGSIFACYDMMRGTLADLRYSHTLKKGELVSARELLDQLPTGSLVLGDRLYGTPKFLSEVQESGLYGVFRRPRSGLVKVQEELGRVDYGNGTIEDLAIILGSRVQLPARLIRLSLEQKTYEFATNVLDPKRLSATEIVDLYRGRWEVERMFYDLKEVLNLNRFYCGNANAVAMQVYASAIVHTAMRVAQGRIASDAAIEPEQISEAKLFPLLGATSATLVTLEMGFLLTKQANPGVRLRKPDWRAACCLQVPLWRILADKTRGERPRDTKNRFEWAKRWRELPPPTAPPRSRP
ncbi:MAG: IS4 family transposase [Planctomycetota bacterium]|nr:IS4 family transposase [Planctomycetota bacterium]